MSSNDEKKSSPVILVSYPMGRDTSLAWDREYSVRVSRRDGRPMSAGEVASVFRLALRNEQMVPVEDGRGSATVH